MLIANRRENHYENLESEGLEEGPVEERISQPTRQHTVVYTRERHQDIPQVRLYYITDVNKYIHVTE